MNLIQIQASACSIPFSAWEALQQLLNCGLSSDPGHTPSSCTAGTDTAARWAQVRSGDIREGATRFSQFYFACNFSSALREWKLHHRTFRMLNRCSILIQRYVRMSGRMNTAPCSYLSLLTALFYPPSPWYTERFPKLDTHTQWLASAVLCLKPLPRNF